MNKWTKLVLCILAPLAVGGVAGLLTAQGVESWYNILVKPSFNPPNGIFGPVWTVLYTLMGISYYLVIMQLHSAARKQAIVIYWVQLFLNFWWSILFFTFHMPGIALLEQLILWMCILLMILRFKRVHKAAGYLQIPYLLWVSFATLLNASIVYLNG